MIGRHVVNPCLWRNGGPAFGNDVRGLVSFAVGAALASAWKSRWFCVGSRERSPGALFGGPGGASSER